jgi:hypothetical protein
MAIIYTIVKPVIEALFWKNKDYKEIIFFALY